MGTAGFLACSHAAAQEAPEKEFRILDQEVIKIGPRSIIYNWVETPVLKPQPKPVAPLPPRAPSAEELALTRQWEAKSDVSLFLSSTVFDHRVTEVRWWREGGEYVIWSDIDFNLFRGLFGIETTDTRYNFFLGIGNESSADVQEWNEAVDKQRLPANLKRQIPSLPVAVTPGASSYKVISVPKTGNHVEALKALADLHRYYDANRDRLASEYAESEAARITQEQWNKEHPPLPQNATINFFPIRSVHAAQGEEEVKK